jgi:polar amino acid transport system substrate-binding protein
MRNYRILLIPLLLAHISAHAAPLAVAADEWCPFNCQPGSAKPGYVVELLEAVFANQGIEYRVLPWKRAVLKVQRGEGAAVIGAIGNIVELEQLQIGQEPVGYASDCLFIPANSTVRYQGRADDLNSLKRVGVALGYAYNEGFGEWLARPENKAKTLTVSGEQPAARNLRMLAAGGLDGVLESGAVMNYLLRNGGLENQVISAGCDTPVPIYVAFGPKNSQGDTLVKQFDEGMAELRKSGKLAEILARYGLQDWQQ